MQLNILTKLRTYGRRYFWGYTNGMDASMPESTSTENENGTPNDEALDIFIKSSVTKL